MCEATPCPAVVSHALIKALELRNAQKPPFEAQAEALKTCPTFIGQWVRLSDLVWD